MIRSLALALALTMTLAAQEKKSDVDPMLQMYIDLAKPVAEHKLLESWSGRWNVTSKAWMDPAKPPLVSTGTATGRMILGGRFLQLDASLKGEIDADSLTLLGFDRRSGEYTMTGYDTLGTYYITAAGKADADRKTVTLQGSYAQPPTGQLQSYRFVFERTDERRHVWKLFFAMPDGKEMLVNEMVLARER